MKRNLYCTYKVKREIFQVKHLKLEQNNFDIHNILKRYYGKVLKCRSILLLDQKIGHS